MGFFVRYYLFTTYLCAGIALAEQAAKDMGRLDCWVSNAGGADDRVPRTLMEMPERQWDFQLNLNLKAVWTGAQAASKIMKEQGSGTIGDLGRIPRGHAPAVLGLPEVRLGIHPGFGGTVRSIRTVGVFAAMDMMLTGRVYQGQELGARRRWPGGDGRDVQAIISAAEHEAVARYFGSNRRLWS